MAVLMTLEVPGGTVEQYDRANEILGIAAESDAPPGLVSHVCGRTDDGVIMVDVWESLDALDRFAHDRLGDALRDAGMPEVRPDVEPAHNVIHGAGTEANVIVMITAPGLTVEAYDGLVAGMDAHVGSGENHPAVLHVAAVDTDGNVHVVDLWDSAEAFDEFTRRQIGPAARDALGPMEPRIVPVYKRLRGPSAGP
jgi:hypothetical protein